MINEYLIKLVLFFMVISNCCGSKIIAADLSVKMNIEVKPWYKYREDGKPGREILLSFSETQLFGKVKIELECEGKFETKEINFSDPVNELSILLPDGAGIKNLCQARIKVYNGQKQWQESIIVPVKRQWDVYIYPHSHVDIGYTNTQEIVEKIHVRNIDIAIDIAKKTQHYSEGARFVWNPEVAWVVDSYLRRATTEQKKSFFDAVDRGWICLDGSYLNMNTSASSDEEILRLFHYGNKLEELTGKPITTMTQFDIPGASWGVVQAAAQSGVEAFLSFTNHFDRKGTVREAWENKAFYWLAPDNSNKILYIQGCPYGYGFVMKGSKYGIKKIQSYTDEYDRLSTDNPMKDFIDPFIFEQTEKLEKENSPYDMFIMTWSMADNCLIDADLPEAVKIWNETYAYPKLIIAGAKEIATEFENRYADIIPSIKGDYTEYWTDSQGTDAKRVGLNRLSKEKLVQVEKLWSMLNKGKKAPVDEINASWKWIQLGSEHTWGYFAPDAELAKEVEATKASYFENGFKTSQKLLKKTLGTVEKKGSNKIAVLNTLSWDRSDVVILNKEQSKLGERVVDDKGKPVESQRLSTGELAFWAENIPALSSKVFKVTGGEAFKTSGCTVKESVLENDFIKIKVDALTGDITELIDKETGINYVDEKSEYAINSYRYLKGADSADKAIAPSNIKIRIKEKGALISSLLIESKAKGCKWLKREIQLNKYAKWVDLKNSIDKISTRDKEGIHFGFAFNVPDGQIKMDIPWGVMTPEYDQIPGANKNWLSIQRWIDISNKDYGVTWTSILSPLVEVGEMSANVIGQANGSEHWRKSIDKSQTIFSWAINNHWHTNCPLEQGGEIKFRYQILPHQSFDPSVSNRFALERNRPLLSVQVSKNPISKPIVNIDNPNVAISTLKMSDDGKGMILRLRSVSDKKEKVKLTWPDGKPDSLRLCNAEEKPGEAVDGTIEVLPHGLSTIYINF